MTRAEFFRGMQKYARAAPGNASESCFDALTVTELEKMFSADIETMKLERTASQQAAAEAAAVREAAVAAAEKTAAEKAEATAARELEVSHGGKVIPPPPTHTHTHAHIPCWFRI
jgi:hypothetical protein